MSTSRQRARIVLGLAVALLSMPSTSGPDVGSSVMAGQTATLLTDGRVLIAGGVSNSGALVSQAELWDPWSRTLGQRADGARATLSPPRARHTATLLADGSVLLWGGVNVNGTGLDSGEVFDPQGGRFHPIDVPPPGLDPLVDGPHVAGSLPGDGDRDVPVDVMIAVRFSQPVRVNTLNPSTVLLSSRAGIELITIVPAEGGRLIFITPTVALSSNTVYSLSLVGATDIAGRLVTPTAIHFTTE